MSETDLLPVPSSFYVAGERQHRAEMWTRSVRETPRTSYWYARECYLRTGTDEDKAAMLACLDGEGAPPR